MPETDLSRYEHNLKLIERDLTAYNALHKSITTSYIRYKQRHFDPDNLEYRSNAIYFNKRILDLLDKKLVLLKKKHELAGILTDLQTFPNPNRDGPLSHRDIVNILVDQFRHTILEAPHEDREDSWQGAAIKRYNPTFPWTDLRIDAIGWGPAEDYRHGVSIIHLIPPKIAEWVAVHTLGVTDASQVGGHIWSVENSIQIAQVYGKLFHNGSIAIVPSYPGAALLIVRLLDEQVPSRTTLPSAPGPDLDGRTLHFLYGHPPAMQYLYFTFVLNILRCQRRQAPGWWKNYPVVTDALRFPKEARRIRKVTLKALARRIGLLTEEEADEFVACCHVSDVGFKKPESREEEAAISILELAYSGTMEQLEEQLARVLMREDARREFLEAYNCMIDLGFRPSQGSMSRPLTAEEIPIAEEIGARLEQNGRGRREHLGRELSLDTLAILDSLDGHLPGMFAEMFDWCVQSMT